MEFLNENLYQDLNTLSYTTSSPNCLSDEEQLASLSTSMFDDLFLFNNSSNIFNQSDQHKQHSLTSLNETLCDVYLPLSPPLSSSLYDSFNDCSSSVSPNWVIYA